MGRCALHRPTTRSLTVSHATSAASPVSTSSCCIHGPEVLFQDLRRDEIRGWWWWWWWLVRRLHWGVRRHQSIPLAHSLVTLYLTYHHHHHTPPSDSSGWVLAFSEIGSRVALEVISVQCANCASLFTNWLSARDRGSHWQVHIRKCSWWMPYLRYHDRPTEWSKKWKYEYNNSRLNDFGLYLSLLPGGNVIVGVCLSFCFSVTNLTKAYNY